MMLMARARSSKPLACVLGDLNLVRPLGLAGIRCAVVAEPRKVASHSRFAADVIETDSLTGPGDLADRLVSFARSQSAPPVLFYQEDYHLLFVSRYRDVLASEFRFVFAAAELVENLVDKVKFQAFAQTKGLPVPRSVILSPRDAE